jgi:hypothetical protein
MAKYKYDFFISYSSGDRAYVRKLAEALRGRSRSVFLDVEQLKPGEPWQEALDQAVRSARSVLVLVGKSDIGPWAQAEIAYAIRRQIEDPSFRVIAVIGPGASPEQLPPLLQTLSYIDLRKLDPKEFDRLEAAVKARPRSTSRSGGQPPKVFLCHAKEDARRIERLCFKLQDDLPRESGDSGTEGILPPVGRGCAKSPNVWGCAARRISSGQTEFQVFSSAQANLPEGHDRGGD